MVTFQDLLKAYNRVNITMLEHAIRRIKIPDIIVKLLCNLFSNSKKKVIGHYGIAEPYTSIIGIDQGEVISPSFEQFIMIRC